MTAQARSAPERATGADRAMIVLLESGTDARGMFWTFAPRDEEAVDVVRRVMLAMPVGREIAWDGAQVKAYGAQSKRFAELLRAWCVKFTDRAIEGR